MDPQGVLRALASDDLVHAADNVVKYYKKIDTRYEYL